jgi:hypothetical protein
LAHRVADPAQNVKANGSGGSASNIIWVSRAGTEWPDGSARLAHIVSHGSYMLMATLADLCRAGVGASDPAYV